MEKTVILEIAGMENRFGIQNFLMNTLRQFDHNIIRVDFISQQPGPYDEEIESYGGEIYRVPKLKRIKEHCTELMKLFKEHPEITAVHIHGNTAVGCVDALIAKRSNVKRIIVHSHNDGCSDLRGKFLHYTFRFLIRNSITDRFCCSNAAGEWMFGKKADYRVIRNAIDIRKFMYCKSKDNEIRSEYNISNCKVIGHVGRMEKQKNHEFIFNVFQNLLRKHPESRLMLVGCEGTLKNKLIEYSKDLDIFQQIIWVNETDNVEAYLSAMDAFIFPSLWEGLGISLVEAQASGIPCLVSERIKKEACVTDLIHVKSLNESLESWADELWNLASSAKCRNDRKYSIQLSDAGYDIHNMAMEMQDFYINCRIN